MHYMSEKWLENNQGEKEITKSGKIILFFHDLIWVY